MASPDGRLPEWPLYRGSRRYCQLPTGADCTRPRFTFGARLPRLPREAVKGKGRGMNSFPGSLVITAVKNEGPYLLQWVAWQQALGFENILVVHNDCTDFSVRLLKLLEVHGVLTQQRHWPKAGEPPKISAYQTAHAHALTRAADWVFITDVDERLVIHEGDGSLRALLQDGDLPALGFALNWRIFGTQGEFLWDDRILHRHYTMAARPGAPQNACFKSIFRHPTQWDHLGGHGPKGWRGEGRWNTGAIRMLRGNGDTCAAYINRNWAKNATQVKDITHDRAQISHYALLSIEQYGRKKGVPSPALLEDRYDERYFDRYDRNEEQDLSAMRNDAAFETAMQRLLAIPGIEALHHRCCMAYLEELASLARRDVTEDPRYARHVEGARNFRRLVQRSMARAAQ